MKDIVFEPGEKWEHAQCQRISYEGEFDGNGHKISNLNSDCKYQGGMGFINSAKNAKIRNLILENVDMNGTHNVGGIVGVAEKTVIDNCIVSGNVKGEYAVGGITGWNKCEAKIKNCEFKSGNIEAKGTLAGGITGDNNWGSTIIKCTAGGNVSSEGVHGLLVGQNTTSSIFICNVPQDVTSVKELIAIDNDPMPRLEKTLAKMTKQLSLPSPIEQKTKVPEGFVGVTNKEELKDALEGNKDTILMEDIDFEFEEFWKTSRSHLSFTKKLDGNGHKLSNLKIGVNHRDDIAWSDNTKNTGLIGEISNAEIKNLILQNVLIKGGMRAGAIAGSNHRSTIVNCAVSGQIYDDYRLGISAARSGGLVGVSSGGEIKNCTVNADVEGSMYVGGIVGQNFANKIIGCKFDGNVISEPPSGGGNAGGIAGENDSFAIIKNCISRGTVKAKTNSGGLAGVNRAASEITNSTTYSTVTSQ